MTKAEPASGFNLKTQTRPYYLSDRVKPDSLGSSQAEYPRDGLLLPSLVYARCGTHHIRTHIIQINQIEASHKEIEKYNSV